MIATKPKTLYEVDERGVLRLNFHSGQIQTWDSVAQYIFMIAGTQGGKCVDPRTTVTLANGDKLPIYKTQPGDIVLSLGTDNFVHRNPIRASFSTGVKPAYRMKTRLRNSIVLTKEHPLFTPEGWKPFGELFVGDLIGVPKFLINDIVADNCYSDVYWDRIEDIEYLDDREMWDITVANGHNFIAQNVFAHNTSFGPWWLEREIYLRGAGDYIAATASYDLFRLKMLPEIRNVFEHVLQTGRYWPSAKVMELMDPVTRTFLANRADDRMWGRIILRSASAEGGLESATAKGVWLDEVGQDDFRVTAWQAVERRTIIHKARILGTTTPYSLGWLKQLIYDQWKRGNKNIDVIQFGSDVNPLIEPEMIEQARLSMPAWKFDMFYKGQFGKPENLIYNDFDARYKHEGGHVVEPFDIPQEWPRIVGVDPGAVNLGLIWLAHDTQNDLWYAYREKHGGRLPMAEHARAAVELAAIHKERVIRWYVGATGETQQRMDWGSVASPALPPPSNDVESGIDRVIALFRQHRLYIFNNLFGLIDELSTYSRVLTSTGDATEVIKDKSTYHHLDALRYAAAGTKKVSLSF